MPVSITSWSQLFPSPLSPSLQESLAAPIRDPAWMLARQWQLGEFLGADAGSPAFAQLGVQIAPITGWRPSGSQQAYTPMTQAPFEAIVEAEPLPADVSVSVELGQLFEELLAQNGITAQPSLRATYAIAPATSTSDPETTRFLGVCAGRALDGVALYRAAVNNTVATPAGVDTTKFAASLSAFLTAVHTTFGTSGLGLGDAPAWRADRLEYGVELTATLPNGGTAVLSAQPDRLADFDWYAFDVTGTTPGPQALTPTTQTIIPSHVRFRGMPNARYWDFDNRQTDFGAITVDKRDLGKLVLMDFMLLHGNDWFIVPIEQPAATLCRVAALTVRDVFGGQTLVERAEQQPSAPGRPWTVFTTSNGTALEDFLLVPASAARCLQSGPTLEEVRFFRDHVAELAWAVEQTIENGIGAPSTQTAPPSSSASPTATTLRYQIESSVPPNWYPLVPEPDGHGGVALAAATLAGGVAPSGRILAPLVASTSTIVPEEEVPSVGAQVRRVPCLSRGFDGSTWVWIARRKSAGTGEVASGLRFDTTD
jgi:hypothetical protein